MNLEPPRNSVRPSTGVLILFAVCTVLVGAIGSVEISRAGLVTVTDPRAFESMLPVVLTGELFAYFAVMLIQLGGTVPVAQVFVAAILAMALRALQACIAAALGGPNPAEGFGAAFAHYYAENYAAAFLQVAVTTLFLWLIRGMFERPPSTMLFPQSDVPDMEPERMRGFHHGTAERRKELIDELMRGPGDAPGPVPAAASEPLACAAEGSEAEALPPAEPALPPLALAPTTAEPAAATAPSQPVQPVTPVASAAAAAQGPLVLTPQQSVVLALREETENEAFAPDAVVAEFRPVPSGPQLTLIAQAVTDAVSALGGEPAVVRVSQSGRAFAVVARDAAELDRAVAVCDSIVSVGAAICGACSFGAFRQVMLGLKTGYVGLGSVVRGQEGFAAAIALPETANFGVVSSTLSRLAEGTQEVSLPPRPPVVETVLAPAHADDALLARVGPLLEWVPEAAGLQLSAVGVGGRQAVLLARRQPSAQCAAPLVHGAEVAGDLCEALGWQVPEMLLWTGDQGAVACAPAEAAGQHLLLCLAVTGPAASVQANVQLGQVLKGLARLG